MQLRFCNSRLWAGSVYAHTERGSPLSDSPSHTILVCPRQITGPGLVNRQRWASCGHLEKPAFSMIKLHSLRLGLLVLYRRLLIPTMA